MQAVFDNLFCSSEDVDCTLNDISNVNPIRSLSKNSPAKCFDMSCLPTKGCIPTGGEIKPYNGGVRFKNGDTIIARITPCLENGKAAFINILDEDEIAFGSTEYIVFSAKGNIPSEFYYFLIRNQRFVQYALQFMNGSSGRQRVSGEELAAFQMKKPSEDDLMHFAKVSKPVMRQMKEASLEIDRLQKLQDLLVSQLSSR